MKPLKIEIVDMDNVNETGYYHISSPTRLNLTKEEHYRNAFELLPEIIGVLQGYTEESGCPECGGDPLISEPALNILKKLGYE